MRSAAYHAQPRWINSRSSSTQQPQSFSPVSQSRPHPICPMCKQANRPDYNHSLSSCSFIPEADRRVMPCARLISALNISPGAKL